MSLQQPLAYRVGGRDECMQTMRSGREQLGSGPLSVRKLGTLTTLHQETMNTYHSASYKSVKKILNNGCLSMSQHSTLYPSPHTPILYPLPPTPHPLFLSSHHSPFIPFPHPYTFALSVKFYLGRCT
jgi:hypothetical protein